MTAPTRILLSDDLYALEEEMHDPNASNRLSDDPETATSYSYWCRCGRKYDANEADRQLIHEGQHKNVCEDCQRRVSEDNGMLVEEVPGTDTEPAHAIKPDCVRWSVAPATETPRQMRPEAWKAGRLMVLSALSGAAFMGLLWWLT